MVKVIDSDSAKQLFISLKKTELEFFQSYTNESPLLRSLNENLQLFDHSKGIKQSLEELTNIKLNYRESLQNHLTYILQEKRVKDMDANMKDLVLLNWWRGQCNPISGKWLEVFPKFSNYIINNEQFRAGLRFKLRFATPYYIPGSRCSCKDLQF
jgi:hypothetical protein